MAIFDDELRGLKENLIKLGAMVESAVNNSIRSLVTGTAILLMRLS